jgi:hypothetical protein
LEDLYFKNKESISFVESLNFDERDYKVVKDIKHEINNFEKTKSNIISNMNSN